MRRICYQVASSLDGYIAGPGGEYDWIPDDPDIDFGALFERFGTLLMGRKTYEVASGGPAFEGVDVAVVSRTLRPEDHPGVTVLSGDLAGAVDDLRSGPGKDIWLFGGGELFRGLLEVDRVDTVELAVMPIVLGDGIPFLPAPSVRRRLRLTSHRVYPNSGIVFLEYDVERGAAGSSA